MLNTLALVNFGPLLETFTLTIPQEGCTISGPSGCGKSTLIDAYALAHWCVMADGSPVVVDAVRGDGAHITVSGGDAKVRVDVSPRGAWTRQYRGPGDDKPRRLSTALDLADALDSLAPDARYGSRGETARRIMRPESWLDLYTGESGARRFRDAIVAALPPVDMTVIVAGLMSAAGHELVDGDPVELADKGTRDAKVLGALSRQRDANTARSSAEALANREAAALVTAQAKLKSAQDTAPTVDQKADADAILATTAAWSTYDTELMTWRRSESTRLLASGRLDAYRASVAALGDEPTVDTAAAGEADAALSRARGEHQRLTAAVGRAEAEVNAEAARVEAERIAAAERVEAEARAERERVIAAQRQAEADARHEAALARQREEAAAETARVAAQAAEDLRLAVARAEESARRPQPEPVAPVAPPARDPNPFTTPAPAPSLFAAAPKSTICPACKGTGKAP